MNPRPPYMTAAGRHLQFGRGAVGAGNVGKAGPGLHASLAAPARVPPGSIRHPRMHIVRVPPGSIQHPRMHSARVTPGSIQHPGMHSARVSLQGTLESA